MMASHFLVGVLHNIHRSGIKTCFSRFIVNRLQYSFVLHVRETNLPQSLQVFEAVNQEKDVLPVTEELIPVVKFKPPKRKDPDKWNRELLALRLQLLQKQLKCKEEEILEILNSAPRLCALSLLDSVIRNIEILLHVYNVNDVMSLVENRVTVLTQVDNTTLLQLVRCHDTKQGIKSLSQRIDLLVKEDLSPMHTETEIIKSVMKPSKLVQTLLTGGLSYSNVREKIQYLLSEGISEDFLKEHDSILLFSMKRIKQEIQYVKKEFGEIDLAVLPVRFGAAQKAKTFRKSVKIAFELLDCSKSDFTRLQIDHISRVYPGNVEKSIMYLLSLGFSYHDIRSCVYIIGQSQENIDKAKHEILRNCEIDINNKKEFINAIQYQIKKWEGFGF